MSVAKRKAVKGSVRIEIKIDRVLELAWDAAAAELAGAEREGAGAFDRKWETVDAIINHDPPLYLAGGIATTAEFFRQYCKDTTVRTALRLVRVARYASPVEEERYTISKLDAALGWIDVQTGGLAKGRIPVDFAKLRFSVERDGARTRVGLDEATVQEIRLETRKLQRKAHRPHPSASPVVLALNRALGRGRLKGIGIHQAHGKLSLTAIPMEAVAELASALSRVKLPH